MENINEQNKLIYAEAKLGSNNIGIPLRNPNKDTKAGWEKKLERQIKKLREQAKPLTKEKYTCTQRNEKT